MTLKHRFTYTFTIISSFLILFTGCRKEEIDFNYSNARVEVILSPGGVGDQGYNDKILRGFQEAAVKYGFTLAVHVPEAKEQGIQIYEDWLNTPLDDECERSLFVFSGSEYEYLLEDLTLSDDSRRDVLMLETEREYDGIYTFNVGCYAASYLAGASSVLDDEGEEQMALIIAANPHDKQVKRAVDGYSDGYLAAGGNGCDVHYLSDAPDGGYQMPDEAYRYCMMSDVDYRYYFSVAGASNKGMYRFSRESYNLAVGMDDNMGLFSFMITMSVVKHMDRIVVDILGDLLARRNIPHHQTFTYLSGYEELVFSEGISSDWFFDISDIRNRIVEIEQSYEESLQ